APELVEVRGETDPPPPDRSLEITVRRSLDDGVELERLDPGLDSDPPPLSLDDLSDVHPPAVLRAGEQGKAQSLSILRQDAVGAGTPALGGEDPFRLDRVVREHRLRLRIVQEPEDGCVRAAGGGREFSHL